jgi:integrase
MAQPYKHPKSGIYHLRRKVPDALRAALGREHKRSLKTHDPDEAKVRFAEAWIDSERVFALARAQANGEASYSRQDAQQLAARWLRAEQERMDGSGDYTSALASVSSVQVEQGDDCEEHEVQQTLRDVSQAHPELLDWRETVQNRLERALRRESLPVPPKGSTAYQGLFNAFEEQLDKLSAWALERHYGEPAARGVGVPAWAPIEAEKPAETVRPDKARTLRDLFSKYSDKKKLDDGDNRSTQKTLAEYRARLDDFIELHGNLAVREVSRELIAEHRALLARMPSKGTGIRGLMAPQLIEKADREHLPRLSAPTIRNRLRALSAVFSYGVLLGWVNENPVIASGAAKAAAKAATKHQASKAQRNHYTHDELRTMFAGPAFADPSWSAPRADFGRAWYWLPLLLYYTGARREELAQLAVSDVQRDEAAGWFLSILERDSDDDDRTVKTEGARRRIPLHPDLIERGFVAYVQELPRTGRVFPKLAADAKGFYGANFGRRWAAYLRDTIRLDSPARPSHGFRHTFKTLCREVGIPEDVHDAITGHAGGGGVARGYGAMPLVRMAEEIKKLPAIQ